MSQTITQTVTSLRLKLPENITSTLKLPIGIPKLVGIPEVKIPEVKRAELEVKTLPLTQQLALEKNVGTTTIGNLANNVDMVTSPPLRPTLQNASMIDVFSKPITRSQKTQMQKETVIEENKLEPLKVTETDLRLFSFEEMKRMAFFEVENTADNGLGSVNDIRGGVVDDDSLCGTCKKGNHDCPGHPGILIFARPILHPKGISIVIKILKCICIDCGYLKVTRKQLEDKRILKKTGENRLDAVLALAESAICRYTPEGNEEKCTPNPTFISKTSKEMDTIWIEEKIPGRGKKINMKYKLIHPES